MLAVMVLSLVEKSLNTRLSKAPSTGVEGLFLSPDNRLGVGVAIEVLLELLPREGVKLLETGDGDVVDLVVGTVLVQGGVDLTRADDDTVDLLTGLDGALLVLRVFDEGAELSVLADEVLNARAGKRVTEQRLGEEDDEG